MAFLFCLIYQAVCGMLSSGDSDKRSYIEVLQRESVFKERNIIYNARYTQLARHREYCIVILYLESFLFEAVVFAFVLRGTVRYQLACYLD